MPAKSCSFYSVEPKNINKHVLQTVKTKLSTQTNILVSKKTKHNIVHLS